jgi:hypothetical protein
MGLRNVSLILLSAVIWIVLFPNLDLYHEFDKNESRFRFVYCKSSLTIYSLSSVEFFKESSPLLV